MNGQQQHDLSINRSYISAVLPSLVFSSTTIAPVFVLSATRLLLHTREHPVPSERRLQYSLLGLQIHGKSFNPDIFAIIRSNPHVHLNGMKDYYERSSAVGRLIPGQLVKGVSIVFSAWPVKVLL